MAELWRRSAGELAALIARGEVSSSEVVEAHLSRIAEVNPRLNAVVRVLADEARAGAARADSQVKAGAPLGRLHGVPITVKENIDMAGLPTTNGLPAFAGVPAQVDAPVVERMRAAGAIPIGRTNLPDMGLRIHTDSSLHGLTRNPWGQSLTAGGSSGGEGSALASGMSPLGLGNDIGGSLRNPAHACAIASIRPTAGLVPDAQTIPGADRSLSFQAMAVQGPMARRVSDVRLGLEVLAGAHPLDPWSLDPPPRRPSAACRVALVAAPPGGNTHPAVEAATRRAADALADAGYDVVEACPPRYEQVVEDWLTLLGTDLAAVLDQMRPIMGADGLAFVDTAFAHSPPLRDAAALSHLMTARDGLARDWAVFMEEYPLLLTPAWSTPPFTHGFDVRDEASTLEVLSLMRPVVVANYLGLPSAAVPAGLDPESGAPIGVLVGGRRMHDFACLDAAEVIEARLAPATPIDPAW
jgi:amidase